MNKHLIAIAAAAFLAGCGGGSDETTTSTTSTPAAAAAQLRTAMAAQGGGTDVSAAVSPAQAAEQLLNFAETTFPNFFPVHQTTGTFDPFLFRYYPQTGIYVGVVVKANMGFTLDGVYVMGGPFGDAPMYVGQLSSFITPVDPGTGGPTGPNNGCYDLALHDATGTRIVVVMQHSGISTGTQTMDWTVKGPKTFEGQSAIETDFRLSGTMTTQGQSATSDFTTTSYGRATGTAEFTSYGSQSSNSFSAPGGFTSTSTTKTVYTPPWVSRVFALAVGQSTTETSTSVITTTTSMTGGGITLPPSTTSTTSTTSMTTKFVGREQVTVPAGTYATCKFEITNVGVAGVTTSWVIDGKGIPVKGTTSVDNTLQTHEATSVTLNGQRL
jgi:hypothetical protein